MVARTEGVSGAFVKEVMRQAALRAALDGREPGGAEEGAPAAPPPVAMVHALGAADLPVPPGLFEP